MLFDLLAYALTPSSWDARSLGFLKSSLQVQARYRRCRRAWEPHLAATRRVILTAAALCAQRRTAVILGSGMLHDIPLAELAAGFGRVVLADVVFPWSTRIAARRFRNVELLTDDVTATLPALRQALRDPAGPLPTSRPTRFIDEPALDFVVSVNLLSQLPVAQHRRLARRGGRDEPTLEAYARHLQSAHLEYLRRLPGHTALITDTRARHCDARGRVVEEWDNLHGLELPPASETWDWSIAPAPEAHRQFDRILSVAAFTDWKATAQRA